MTTDRKKLSTILSSVDFPAGKDELVAHAERNGADEDTLAALRAMPRADDYANLTEVQRSVSLDPASEAGQSEADKAEQNTRRTADGLAEHETSTSSNPIVEELGENRGS
ncbi:DUF2795 domain-containing protein [Actinopolyspora mortivallis]|uniref:DUF2795 domain-containing protein n=1 Tax=Actinopolyspora mortivallis TaxID=33906 RepID=A0A2T0H157_ACTMO|nr:DUF2795 domain-containing protein [Actinopolyspora mortivallis]PRW65096.1 hypothetical protein CEP50_00750 [Actinopolyspora mortivallis]